MTKRELIDEITSLNPSAAPAFLAGFQCPDLAQYLQRLQRISPPEANTRPGDGHDSELPARYEPTAQSGVGLESESPRQTEASRRGEPQQRLDQSRRQVIRQGIEHTPPEDPASGRKRLKP